MQEKLRQYLTDHRQDIKIDGDPKTWQIEKLAQGEYNINYLLTDEHRKLVLRLNTASQMHLENQIEYEYRALCALGASRRTPRPVYYDDSKKELPYQFLVMEFLEGGPLDYQKDLPFAAECLADIHATKIDPTFLLSPDNPKRAMIEECRALFAQYRSSAFYDEARGKKIDRMLQIGEKIAEHNEPTFLCCINTELNSGNFLMDRQNYCRLVDWEKPLFGDPAQDLGHFLAPTTTLWKTEHILTQYQIEDFIRQYERAVGSRFDISGIAERTQNYIKLNCLRGLTWCAMAWTQYQDSNRPIQNEDTRKKLDFYISHDFLDRIHDRYMR